MDFLKTLLAYMALMATLGVQEGPAPQTVPTPTPLPAHVTASPVPFQTAVPTATPAPSQLPGPAITPNKRYQKVEFGDKGTAVKKLQNRLIELGFMPKGSADSQYGYQTYNAVKEFQRANFLDVDGVAGPITLTYLYENPNIITLTGHTPVPTATPTPTLPSLVSVNNQTSSVPSTSKSSSGVTSAVTVAPSKPGVTATPKPTATPTAVPDPVDMRDTPAAPAEFTFAADAIVVNGATDTPLTYLGVVKGQYARVSPDVWQNEFGAAVVSLPQLAKTMNWTLSGRNNQYTLKACGYEVSIQFQSNGLMVLVDGEPVFIPEEDAVLYQNTVFVSEGFLRMTINADTFYKVRENKLILTFTNK